MSAHAAQDTQRATIVLHSQGYDRASYALSLASVALAMGMEVHLLLTYGGLKRFVRGHLDDLDEETDAQARPHIERGLASGGIRPIEAQLEDARKLGLRVYACANAMANLSIVRHELAPEVDEVMGLATFLQFARNASINWYI